MPSTEKKLTELYKLIDGIEIAMLTTRRSDGHLISRPMATQERVSGIDLWFATDISTGKLDEIENDPHVNLSYYNMKSREWISISGLATVTLDKALIAELYKPDWKAWFGDNGGAEDGGPNDPRIGLIMVEAQRVEYLVVNKPKPVVLFELVKGMITGDRIDIGEDRLLGKSELESTAARKAI